MGDSLPAIDLGAGATVEPVDVEPGITGAPTATVNANLDVSLSWLAPSDDGGSPITGYQIEASADGSTWSVLVADTGTTATSALLTTAPKAPGVRFRVSAHNNVGTGPPSLPSTSVKVCVADFTSVSPVRVLDTRNSGALGPRSEVAVTVNGGPQAGAVAVNLTSTGATSPSFFTAWADGEPRPNASALNADPGADTANLAIVPIGAGNRIRLYNNAGTGHLVVDVLGFFADCGSFSSISPTRALDTRTTTPLGARDTRSLAVSGAPGYPAGGAAAVVVNLTSTESTAPSFVTAFTGGATRPPTSNLNTEPGTDLANLAIVVPNSSGVIDLYNNSGSGHLIVDVLGWFLPGGDYTPATPARVLDTRNTTALGPVSSVPAPTGATAGTTVIVNLTSTQASAPSFFTVWPSGSPRPKTSNLNTEPGQDVANLAFVTVGTGGQVVLHNENGSGHAIIDLLGSFG